MAPREHWEVKGFAQGLSDEGGDKSCVLQLPDVQTKPLVQTREVAVNPDGVAGWAGWTLACF